MLKPYKQNSSSKERYYLTKGTPQKQPIKYLHTGHNRTQWTPLMQNPTISLSDVNQVDIFTGFTFLEADLYQEDPVQALQAKKTAR